MLFANSAVCVSGTQRVNFHLNFKEYLPHIKDGEMVFTVICLSIGTLKILNFSFVPNGKFIIFRCP